MRIIYHGGPSQTSERALLKLETAGVAFERLPRLALDALGALDASAARDMVILMGHDQTTMPVLRELREKGVAASMIVLKSDIEDKIIADLLDAGADDVIGPDCGGLELAARLRAVSRRSFQKTVNDITLGDLTVPLDGGPVTIGGAPVKLSAREQEVLRLIALRYPRRISKTTIYDSLFALSGTAPHQKVIDSHIHNLRRKLTAADPQGRDFIETSVGLGYRLRFEPICEKEGR